MKLPFQNKILGLKNKIGSKIGGLKNKLGHKIQNVRKNGRNIRQNLKEIMKKSAKFRKFLVAGLGGTLLVVFPVHGKESFEDFVERVFMYRPNIRHLIKIGEMQAAQNRALYPLYKKYKTLDKYDMACDVVILAAIGLANTKFAKNPRLRNFCFGVAGAATVTAVGINVVLTKNTEEAMEIIEQFKGKY